MQIQVSTDHNIEGNEAFALRVEAELTTILSGFDDQITSANVHFSDENGPKVGHSVMRCLIEVRSAGKQPVAVSNTGETVEQALHGAIKKMQRQLESTLGRLHHHKGGDSIRTEESAD